MRRRTLFALGLAAATGAIGQPPPVVAVPYYRAADFVKGAYAAWFAPRARAFAREAEVLARQLAQSCGGPSTGADDAMAGARRQWQATALAWDPLAAVAVGPLLERRSQRQIDFFPIRPQLIERALRSAPADLAALERIGTPAKGLGTLEWLLWTAPRARWTGGGCAYAALLAAEVEVEARALALAFAALAARDWRAEPERAEAAMSELVNQWVGGLEGLRWQRMERPLRSAAGAPEFPRRASGATQRSWAARWSALSALAAAGSAAPPPPGDGLVPLETYLRGRGLNPLADRLAQAAARSGRALRSAAPGAPGKVRSAARELSQLKQLAEAQIAPALEVQIGFSDSDGD